MARCIRNLHRSENRVVFGVCQGLADHFQLSVVWIRLGMIVLSVITFPIALIGYFILAFLLKPASAAIRQEESYEEDFYETDLSSRSLALRRLKSKFDAIESRIRRMETYVTNKSYDWERRFRAGE